MASGSTRDPRYDMVWREPSLADPSTGYLVDLAAGDLPLLLTESGSQGLSIGMTSPYGGRLSQGDLQDADLSQYTARTQRDWSGGRGQRETFAATTAYQDATLDTRIPGHVLPPPYYLAAFTWSGAVTSSSSTPIVAPIVEWDNNYIMARGDELFYNQGSGWSIWTRFAACTATITDLTVVAVAGVNYLVCALGDSTDLQTVTGSVAVPTVTTRAGRRASFVLADVGYLHILTTTGAYVYTADLSTWSSTIQVGREGTVQMTGIAQYGSKIIFASTKGLYSVSADIPYAITTYADQSLSTNGKRLTPWAFNNRLYIPIRYSLYMYDGEKVEEVGRALFEFTTWNYRGTISAIRATEQFLYVAVDAGSTGYSGVYALDTNGRWHTVLRFDTLGRRISVMHIFYQYNTTPPNVETFLVGLYWTGGGGEWIAPTGRPLDLDHWALNFGASGTLTSSIVGGELRLIPKDWYSVIVSADTDGRISSVAQSLTVSLSFDGGPWRDYGTTTFNGETYGNQWEALLAPTSTLAAKTFSSYASSTRTVTLATGNTSDLTAGMFVKMGRHVAQINTIPNSSTFTVVKAVPTASVPAAGTDIAASEPVASTAQYRLSYTNPAAVGVAIWPLRIRAVTLKYQDQLIDKYRMSAQLRVEDGEDGGGMNDRAGGRFPYTADQLRARLYEWVKRATPFRVISRAGNFTMKISNMNESQFTVQPNGSTKSVMIVSMIET